MGPGPLHQTLAPRPRLGARHKARIVVLARAGGTPRDLVRRPRHARTRARARAVCALAHVPTLLPAATPIGVEYSIAVPGTALPWRSPGQAHIFATDHALVLATTGANATHWLDQVRAVATVFRVAAPYTPAC